MGKYQSFSLRCILFFILVNLSFAEAVKDATRTQPQSIEDTLKRLYLKYQNNHAGKVADYIPELAKVNPNYLGIAIVTIDGRIYSFGDANVPFAIESISKPFAYALALEDEGEASMHAKIGFNATGKPFNSVIAIEEMPKHRQNPLVNAGAIQVTSAIKGKDSQYKWQRVLTFLSQLSDGKVALSDKIYQSEMATNQHNRAIAELLKSYGLMYDDDTKDAVLRYTKACSVLITAKQLALMGATLANGGKNPISHQQMIRPEFVKDVLSQMAVNGLYENSGAWWQEVGLPAKSGVGGGILAVVPHQFAIAVYSPRVDEAGNSVRAQALIAELAKMWHLHLLA